MRPALVTMAVGHRHQSLFERHALPTWKAYAKRHGLDLVIFREPLDLRPRAQARSLAWQKCLALTHPSVMRYRQVAWVDTDLVFSAHAPSIFDHVPRDTVGAVDAYNPLDREALAVLCADWRKRGVPFIDNPTPDLYHTMWGLTERFDHVVQAGLMVLDPGVHGPIFHDIYRYEDRGGVEWNHEMRPMSYELQRQARMTWLDPRFNTLWASVRTLRYPHLRRDRIGRWLDRHRYHAAIHATLRDCWGLHFAACGEEVRHVSGDRVVEREVAQRVPVRVEHLEPSRH